MRFVGIDIGGTFTDLALFDSERADVTLHKVPSTPDDPGRALVAGLTELCERAGVAPAEVDGILHGTTVATNAVLEHRGAKTAALTTEGFRDIVHIGRHQRPQNYSVMQDIPWQSRPFVERERRLTVAERLVPPAGDVLVPLDEEAVRAHARTLREEGVTAVAVCFLFSYLDARHEDRAAEILREELPDCFVTSSARISPQFREFERFTTACMNAFVGPGTGEYLDRLRAGLREHGFDDEMLVMRSNGGVASLEEAAQRPVTLMLSGPAAGVLGARWAAGLVGRDALVTFDMGGTSADIGMVTEAGISEASTRDTQIAGYPLLVPTFDIHTIGAGGGSIARVDAGGALQVGPRSAGAVPGPACYGHGGDEATVTDAQLVLGRLSPEHFLGGGMALDPARAEAVVGRLAAELGMSPLETAAGIVTLANSNMAQTIRAITVERGHDPRRFALVAYGGAGPLHAAELAAMLEIDDVVIPPHPGITSAAGLLTSDLRYDELRTVLTTEDRIDAAVFNAIVDELAEELVGRLVRDGVAHEQIVIDAAMDCRYLGQGFELRIPFDDGRFDAGALERFHATHEREYGHRLQAPLQVVNLRVRATGARAKLDAVTVTPGTLEEATLGKAPCHWRVDDVLAPLPTLQLARERLPVRTTIAGPAIVFQQDSTIAVPPGWELEAAPDGPLVLRNLETSHG